MNLLESMSTDVPKTDSTLLRYESEPSVSQSPEAEEDAADVDVNPPAANKQPMDFGPKYESAHVYL